MKFLYKYPQKEFPYEDLIKENARRSRQEREYNLVDTGCFDDDAYWDITIETAKDSTDEESLTFRVTAWNRGSKAAKLHIIPQFWFRNTWTWGHEAPENKPSISESGPNTAHMKHYDLGERYIELSPSPGVSPDSPDIQPDLLFTENETNTEALGWGKNKQPYVKDAFHRYICDEEDEAVNPKNTGTKC